MPSDIRSFLSRSPVFRNVPDDQLNEMAGLFQEAQFPVGAVILTQGSHNEVVYFLRSGRLAVRVHTDDGVDTVAYLNPPQCFGELSFLTGRPCVADVAVAADATVVFLPQSAVAKLPKDRQEILRGLMLVIAERLQETVSQQAKAPDSPMFCSATIPGGRLPPVSHANWPAPWRAKPGARLCWFSWAGTGKGTTAHWVKARPSWNIRRGRICGPISPKESVSGRAGSRSFC
jgi:hypothetical protein